MPLRIRSQRALPMIVLLALAALVILTPISGRGIRGADETLCLGFILIFAFILARLLASLRLPEISGYIVAGLLAGPFVLNILSGEVVRSLQLFDDLALAIIALIAGGEMRLSFLRRSKGAIGSIIFGQVFFAFIGALLVVFLARGQLAFLSDMGPYGWLAVALIFGVVTAARSPSTTIGVVTEAGARGPFTDFIVGVTVLLDVIILVLVAFLIPTVRTLTIPGEAFSLVFAKDLFASLGGTILAGVCFGAVVGVYMRWVNQHVPIFLVGLGFVGSMACRHFHLEPLLAFMIAGFIVENFTRMGSRLIANLERSALPVYVIFFAISGASIDLSALASMWSFAVLIVVMRAAAFYVGSMAAAVAAKEVKPHAGSLWLGLLSQAGVTIGIATAFERRFAWGADLKTVILAVVALNQLIGPVALKFILERKGEAGATWRERSPAGRHVS